MIFSYRNLAPDYGLKNAFLSGASVGNVDSQSLLREQTNLLIIKLVDKYTVNIFTLVVISRITGLFLGIAGLKGGGGKLVGWKKCGRPLITALVNFRFRGVSEVLPCPINRSGSLKRPLLELLMCSGKRRPLAWTFFARGTIYYYILYINTYITIYIYIYNTI